MPTTWASSAILVPAMPRGKPGAPGSKTVERARWARARATAARSRGDDHTAVFHERAAAAHDLTAQAADAVFEADARVEGRRTD
jgi:hypothetical protein